MNHPAVGLLAVLVLVLQCPSPTHAAPSSTERQNAAAKKALLSQEPTLTCPEAVQAKVEAVRNEKGLPVLLATPSEAKLKSMADYRVTPSSPVAQAFRANPDSITEEQIEEAANAFGMSKAQFMASVKGETPAPTGTPSKGPKQPQSLAQVTAKITLENGVPEYCDANCEMNIKWSFVNSIALWKTLCSFCTDDFMSVISDGKNYWVDARVLQWIRQPNGTSVRSFPFTGQISQVTLQGDFASNRFFQHQLSNLKKYRPVGMSQEEYEEYKESPEYKEAIKLFDTYKSQQQDITPGLLEGYELVEKNDAVYKKLCEIQTTAQPQPRLLQHLKFDLCGIGSKPPASDTANMHISLSRGTPGDDLLACAKGGASVTIWFNEARYKFPDMFGRETILVGPSAAPIHNGMAVVLHEVGHWFKLPHLIPSDTNMVSYIKKYNLQGIPDVMLPIYSNNMCISKLTQSLLMNMADPDIFQNNFADGGCLRAR